MTKNIDGITKPIGTPSPKGKPKLKRKPDRGENSTREAILEAALLEFAELGFEGTSARRIGKRAEVDFTLITYYFGTKENLWREVAQSGYQKLRNALLFDGLNFSNLSAGQRLKIKLEAGLRFLIQNRALFRMMQQEFQINSGRIDWTNEHFFSDLYLTQLDDLRAAQVSGEIIDGNPKLLFMMMLISIRTPLFSEGALRSILGEDPFDANVIEEFLSLFDRIFFKSVAPLKP